MFVQLFFGSLCLSVFLQYTNANPMSSVNTNAIGGYVPIHDKDLIFSYTPSTLELVRFGDNLYYFGVIFKANFFQAMQFCKFHGFDLLSIENKEENDFIFDQLQSFLGTGEFLFWSSGVKIEPDNRWVWMFNGKPIVYFPWLTGQPGNGATERYMEVRYSNTNRAMVFNDQVPLQLNHVICKLSIPKTTVTI